LFKLIFGCLVNDHRVLKIFGHTSPGQSILETRVLWEVVLSAATMAATLESLRLLIDVQWIHDTLGETDCWCVEIEAAETSEFCGDMFTLTTEHDVPEETGQMAGGGRRRAFHEEELSLQLPRRTRLIKTFVGDEKLAKSEVLGLAREALFLSEFVESGQADDPTRCALRPLFPRIFFAQGDMATGHKIVVMERLQGAHTGQFLAPHHPSSWEGRGDTVPSLVGASWREVDQEYEVTAESLRMIARLHAVFWQNNDALRDWDFLRGRDTCLGSDTGAVNGESPQWRSAQDSAIASWARIKEEILTVQQRNGDAHTYLEDKKDKLFADKAGVRIPEHMVSCIEASLGRVDFASCEFSDTHIFYLGAWRRRALVHSY